MKLSQLKLLMKEHGISMSFMNKPDMLRILVEKGILPESELPEPVKEKRQVLPKYEYLKTIRNNPISVEILDKNTNEVFVYRSLYKASMTFKTCILTLKAYNGKVWRDRYAITVYESSTSEESTASEKSSRSDESTIKCYPAT